MTKEQFEALTDEQKSEVYAGYELNEGKLVNSAVIKAQTDLEDMTKKFTAEQAAHNELKTAHNRILTNGAPMPDGGQEEDAFVSLFKNII